MPTDYDIVLAMSRYGGSFVTRLAKCWQCADSENQRKLKAAFPEYWKQYEEMVEAMLKQEAQRENRR